MTKEGEKTRIISILFPHLFFLTLISQNNNNNNNNNNHNYNNNTVQLFEDV